MNLVSTSLIRSTRPAGTTYMVQLFHGLDEGDCPWRAEAYHPTACPPPLCPCSDSTPGWRRPSFIALGRTAEQAIGYITRDITAPLPESW